MFFEVIFFMNFFSHRMQEWPDKKVVEGDVSQDKVLEEVQTEGDIR